MTITTVNSREARVKWRDLLDRILTGESDIVIERNGKPVAAMIPIGDYEDLIDELDDLRAARRAGAIYEAWKQDPSTGESYNKIRSELVGEGLLDE